MTGAGVKLGMLVVCATLAQAASATAEPCVTETFAVPLPGAVNTVTQQADVPSSQFPGLWQKGVIDGYYYTMFANGEAVLQNAPDAPDWVLTTTCDAAEQICARIAEGNPAPANTAAILDRIEDCFMPEVAKAAAEAAAKAKAEAEAKKQAEAKAKADAEAKKAAEAKAKAEAEAKKQAEAKAKVDAEAKKQAEAKAATEAKAKAEAEAKKLAEAKAKADAEAKKQAEAKAAAEAKAKAEAEAEAKKLAEAKAKADAEAKKLAEAEAEAKKLAEAKAAQAAADPAAVQQTATAVAPNVAAGTGTGANTVQAAPVAVQPVRQAQVVAPATVAPATVATTAVAQCATNPLQVQLQVQLLAPDPVTVATVNLSAAAAQLGTAPVLTGLPQDCTVAPTIVATATPTVPCGVNAIPQGPEGITVQRLLVLAGANPGRIDGFPGRRTRNAIVELLGAEGRTMPIPEVITALNQRLCNQSTQPEQ
ncbi:hypothetical protein ACEN2J_01150 [Pseudorhodobacter sp. W20_MBD10_FR17]|uniref:hypothetical protein n=1 Tax=Pseudorhodobacter sp. W20_MBD10_FR17 TaxID=3240266 RepID=UPI003F9B542B